MIYQNGSISVDRDFARFGGRSFAIGQINAVEVREEVPPPRSKVQSILLAAIGVILLLAAAGAGIVAAILALICFGVAWQRWPREQASSWHLLLTTSSGQSQATTSEDCDEVVRLRDAIETAMVIRGAA